MKILRTQGETWWTVHSSHRGECHSADFKNTCRVFNHSFELLRMVSSFGPYFKNSLFNHQTIANARFFCTYRRTTLIPKQVIQFQDGTVFFNIIVNYGENLPIYGTGTKPMHSELHWVQSFFIMQIQKKQMQNTGTRRYIFWKALILCKDYS